MRNQFLIAAVLVWSLSRSFAQNTAIASNLPQADKHSQLEIRDKYQLVEVGKFRLKQGVEFPVEYIENLQQELAKLFVSEQVFKGVIQAGQTPIADQGSVVLVTGTIYNYIKGNQKKRYVGGQFGAGKAEIDGRITFTDASSGQQLLVENMRGVLIGGAFGGKEETVTQTLAQEIVQQAKLMMRRRIPPASPGELANNKDSGTAEPEHHTVTADSKKIDEIQTKLDQEAAAGFRVVDVSITGPNTAELELEKLATPPEAYQYRWIHIRMATHLQKELDSGVDDGFQVVPRSLTWLGPYLAVLMEKPPIEPENRTKYKVTEPVLHSSAQKDVEKQEKNGYLLFDETDSGPLPVLIFEKSD
jgi:hypothetical protein